MALLAQLLYNCIFYTSRHGAATAAVPAYCDGCGICVDLLRVTAQHSLS